MLLNIYVHHDIANAIHIEPGVTINRVNGKPNKRHNNFGKVLKTKYELYYRKCTKLHGCKLSRTSPIF